MRPGVLMIEYAPQPQQAERKAGKYQYPASWSLPIDEECECKAGRLQKNKRDQRRMSRAICKGEEDVARIISLNERTHLAGAGVS